MALAALDSVQLAFIACVSHVPEAWNVGVCGARLVDAVVDAMNAFDAMPVASMSLITVA